MRVQVPLATWVMAKVAVAVCPDLDIVKTPPDGIEAAVAAPLLNLCCNCVPGTPLIVYTTLVAPVSLSVAGVA